MSEPPREAEAIGPEDILTMCELLEEPVVAALLRRAGRHELPEQELSAFLEGLDISDTLKRRLLSAILGPLADQVVQVQADFHYWCYPTAGIRGALRRIDTTCTAYSPMASWLSENPATLVQLRIENAIKSSRLDGLEIDFESAKELLLLARGPHGKPEHAVSNSFGLFGMADEYAQREFDVDLFEEIFDRLTEGIPVPEGWLDRPFPHELPNVVYPHLTPREGLQAISDVMNESRDYTDAHPVIVDIVMERFLSIYEPFPILNGTMSRLLWHYYTARTGYPVLSVVPYSSALTEKGREPGSKVVYPIDFGARRQWVPNADITQLISHRLEVIEMALVRLQRRIETREEQMEALRVLLTADPDLNSRQRTIIGRALRLPSATFRISYHQLSHDIAYSTARADFMELERKGYLQRSRVGHAYVYRPVTELADRVGAKVVQAIGEHALAGLWGGQRLSEQPVER